MVGYLNTHGTSPCLFGNGNEFVDLSLVHDDEIRVSKVSVLDLHDDSPFPDTEPFDYNFEETFWSSLTLGADYDWDGDRPASDVHSWVIKRYGDVIELNDKYGYQRPTAEIIPFKTTFVGRSRTNVCNRHWSHKRSLREASETYDKRRGKAHAK